MAEPNLTSIFGAGASQTDSQLTIVKADLTGLTPSATNTAEAITVALLLKWEGALTPTAQDSNPDQSIRVERGTETVVTTFNNNATQQYKEIPFTITLRQPYVATTINPNQY